MPGSANSFPVPRPPAQDAAEFIPSGNLRARQAAQHPRSPQGDSPPRGWQWVPKAVGRSGTGTNTHPLQCVSMAGGRQHPQRGSQGGWLGFGGVSQGGRILLPRAVQGACDPELGCKWLHPAGLWGCGPRLMAEEKARWGLPAAIWERVQSFPMARTGGGLEEGKKAFWKCGHSRAGKGIMGWQRGVKKHPQHPAMGSGATGTLKRRCPRASAFTSTATCLFPSAWCRVPVEGGSHGAGSAWPHRRAGARLSPARSQSQWSMPQRSWK